MTSEERAQRARDLIANTRDAELARWQAERRAIGAPEGTPEQFNRVRAIIARRDEPR